MDINDKDWFFVQSTPFGPHSSCTLIGRACFLRDMSGAATAHTHTLYYPSENLLMFQQVHNNDLKELVHGLKLNIAEQQLYNDERRL